ncbi:uncharacterized protein F5Z01DRAFT_669182 [Emericellopsis atlantica]|uniref:Uncharacterized protein n=1 Tax=Emericellopsis atlantica TaxID=2614577 RepID=A0A9P7ZCX7_9HYPO|nr:uncharacterized protein F5Z01DRAFT_669182 [Emericellopsis atlantica]KAG9249441.1 hypothetical protein F5Z01DRAFT_669182 [Emericellopsis atlantica]
MVLQLPEQHRQHATPQHRQLLPAAQAPLSMRHSLPSTGDFRPANGGFTPANRPVTSRPQSPLAVMPVMSAPNSPTAPENPSEPLVEINQENLVLRHDGTVYTSPACMVGVPRDKIHPGDQYWEHHWTDVRPEVVKEKECWEQKHQKALKRWAEKKGSESYYYTTKKWVRRGDKIIEFLDDPKQISPYQLLAKKFMNASGGCITSYKTLSCLCETLSELANYDLDIEPLDWMRHRLYEIHLQAPGGSFDLCKILNDFYHDPKLTDLRFKHGHKKRGATFWSKPGRSLRRVASAQLRKRQAAPAALEGPHEDDKGSFTQSRFVVSA